MPLVHDSATSLALTRRVESLTADSPRQWGTMSVGQMLWHVNTALEIALGKREAARFRGPPLPASLLKFFVFNLPWPKGVPTGPDLVASTPHNFAVERPRTLELISALAATPLEDLRARHPLFGIMPGRDWSRLMAKHLDHHLRQFGA